jgi:hypothetical protein
MTSLGINNMIGEFVKIKPRQVTNNTVRAQGMAVENSTGFFFAVFSIVFGYTSACGVVEILIFLREGEGSSHYN